MFAYHLIFCFFLYSSGDHRDLHSFPTRRSSDLAKTLPTPSHPPLPRKTRFVNGGGGEGEGRVFASLREGERDRKSTRLNSSHSSISYAVFCLKKKTYEHTRDVQRTLK